MVRILEGTAVLLNCEEVLSGTRILAPWVHKLSEVSSGRILGPLGASWEGSDGGNPTALPCALTPSASFLMLSRASILTVPMESPASSSGGVLVSES